MLITFKCLFFAEHCQSTKLTDGCINLISSVFCGGFYQSANRQFRAFTWQQGHYCDLNHTGVITVE